MNYRVIDPLPPLTDFIESYWMLVTETESDREIVILPDGRIDVIFAWSSTEGLHVMLMGLDRQASQVTLPAGTVMYAASLKVSAMEHIMDPLLFPLKGPVRLPDDFWGIGIHDLKSFERFVDKISNSISGKLSGRTLDPRKQNLFKLIYQSKGEMSVERLADASNWSARQINRYFNKYAGIPLKEYCDILRFRESFSHLRKGRLFPEKDFADQAHFIRSVKKLAGVTPGDLARNKNGRFIQFSVWREE